MLKISVRKWWSTYKYTGMEICCLWQGKLRLRRPFTVYSFLPSEKKKQNFLTTGGAIIHCIKPTRKSEQDALGFMGTRVGANDLSLEVSCHIWRSPALTWFLGCSPYCFHLAQSQSHTGAHWAHFSLPARTQKALLNLHLRNLRGNRQEG